MAKLSWLHSRYHSIAAQRKLLDSTFVKLNLKILDDWTSVHRASFKNSVSTRYVLVNLYNDNIMKMLTTIYPNHNWDLKSLESKRREEFYTVRTEAANELMETLFHKLKLRNLDGWLFVSKEKMKKYGGKPLLKLHSDNIKDLLKSQYPNYPWTDEPIYNKENPQFFLIENQQIFMEDLFYKLNLKNLGEWEDIPRYRIKQFGGTSLLTYYKQNYFLLLTSIYPNYPWSSKFHLSNNTHHSINKFDLSQIEEHNFLDTLKIIPPKLLRHYIDLKNIASLKVQHIIMQNIFHKLKLNRIDDWIDVRRSQIVFFKGGRKLLEYYNDNFVLLLKTLYPSHFSRQYFRHNNFDRDMNMIENDAPLIISSIKYRPSKKDLQSINNYYRNQILALIQSFGISKEQDWCRLPIRKCKNLFSILSKVFPEHRWDRREFQKIDKKANQRLLFISLSCIFDRFLLIENYHHPKLDSKSAHSLEIDIFIPAFSMGFEYQGEHHYYDIVETGRSPQQIYQYLDDMKCKLSVENNISLLRIPYWWDQKISSLKKTILDFRIFY